MPEAREVDQADEVRRAARELDHDRYLAALLAPRAARDGLLAIAAFHGEIARIPATVAEPTIAAIRLQWWRDQLDDTSAHSAQVINALRRALARHQGAIRDAAAIVDAYEELLQPGALSAPGAVASFAEQSHGTAFRLAARVLGAFANEAAAQLITAAAQSYGRVQLLRVLPVLLHRGHQPFDIAPGADWTPLIDRELAEARSNFAEVRRLAPLSSPTIRQAILPVALVEPYLKALQGLGSKLAFQQATISPLSRVWRIYLAKRRQRF